MKKTLLIFFALFIIVSANTETTTSPSDTLGNKGLGKLGIISDSLKTTDSLATKEKTPSHIFLPSIGMDDDNSNIERINHSNFYSEDFKNFSDIFNQLPFSFNQDLGALGQPNEQMFYGLGFGNISFMQDGIVINNRWQNSYNLNKLNNALIDSVEIAPITKGFLYSTYNNPVSIGMNSRFNFPSRPITHLKFYQASFDEGFVDVLFHTPITNKLGFGINISNSAIDSRFSNSDYESWKFNAQINYQVNDEININANYFYSYDTLALFGGLDTSRILNDNFSTVLYEYDSRARESSRYQLSYNNNANVKILSTIFPNSKTDLTFYYNSTSQKFIQNRDTLFTHLPIIIHDNFSQTIGVSFRNLYQDNTISLDLIANYESSTFNTDVLVNNSTENIFTISGDLKLPFINTKYFAPSMFGKINNYNGVNLYGFGADISGTINNQISYYAGVSWFEQQVPFLETGYHTSVNYLPAKPSSNNSLELGVKFNFKSVFGKISYFSFASENHSIPYISQPGKDSLLINELDVFHELDVSNSGINLNVNFKFWKFIFSNNFSYYFSSREERVYASPDYTLAGKIYYLDFLFNKNLNLKTGINYRFTGGQLPFIYDFEKSLQITQTLTPLVQYSSVPSSFQLDLFLAGTIQETATIFVTLENILDTKYYIVPYYFKQPITLRFGVTWLLYD